MAYLPKQMNRVDRGCKILADIFVALLNLVFAIAFFGLLGGVIAFVVIEAALIGVDYVVPDADDSAGVAVR